MENIYNILGFFYIMSNERFIFLIILYFFNYLERLI